MATSPFAATGPTVNIAAGTSTLNVAVDAGAAWGGDIRIYNSGTVPVFVAFGGSTVSATTSAGVPIAPGAVEVLSMYGATHAAAIVASGSATIYFTPGAGI
jgi:hypothetical protein